MAQGVGLEFKHSNAKKKRKDPSHTHKKGWWTSSNCRPEFKAQYKKKKDISNTV
jgi:hypothetical protein